MPRILIVDDDIESSTAMVRALKQDGHIVDTAFTGEGALRQCSRARFDAIITDLAMPQLSGSAFVTRLRAQGSLEGVPVAVLVPREPGEAAQAKAQVGAVEVVARPIDPSELQHSVRSMLARRRGTISGRVSALDFVRSQATGAGVSTAADVGSVSGRHWAIVGALESSDVHGIGRLGELRLAELMRLMHLGRKTGTLDVTSDDNRITVGFREGEIARVRRFQGAREVKGPPAQILRDACGLRSGRFRIIFGAVEKGDGNVDTSAFLAQVEPR